MTSYSFRAKPAARPFQNGRYLFIRAVVVGLFVMLGIRLVYVQAFLRTDLGQKAARQTKSIVTARHVRGTILDRNGKILAETTSVYSCYLDPNQIKNRKKTAQFVGSSLGISPDKLMADIAKCKSSFLWVKRNVPANIVEAIKSQKMPGVAFKQEWRRNYPLEPLSPHLMGLVGVDGHGLSGIELAYDKVLRGDENSKPGTVQLTIDAAIQAIVEKELTWGAQKTKAKSATAIVQNPATGEILAMASWPPISLSADRPPKPLDMRIPPIVDVFEPGSTFKVVTAAAAIEENIIRPREIFSGEKGKWKIKTITIHDHEARPWMTFDDVFVYSSNIGTAKIAERLGNDRLFQYARMFGFGVFPGSGLPGEAKGVLRTVKQWSGVSKYVVSFGQEVGVTAIQLVGAYSAIANGGMLMEPRFVKRVSTPKDDLDQPAHPVRRVMSEETAFKLTDILSKVVETGTGQFAQVQWAKDLRVAGKTGTAQKFNNEKKRYELHDNLVSFCGFFPASSPTYTMIVILDSPEGRRWGGLDAAPIFRRIAEQLITPQVVS